jgi:hypothetical protein
MRPEIHFNAAWDPIFLSDVDVVLEFLNTISKPHILYAPSSCSLWQCVGENKDT